MNPTPSQSTSNKSTSNQSTSRIERWFFAALMLTAIGVLFAFGFENIAHRRFERGTALIVIGLVSIMTTIWLLIGSQDGSQDGPDHV
jgi:phosphate/sulfate permease